MDENGILRKRTAHGSEPNVIAESGTLPASRSFWHRPFSVTLLASAIFVFRLANALSITTFFQPDEYYQALEPAHAFVFGYGYITWEWRAHLRASFHPLLYSVGYAVTRFFPQNYERQLVRLAPGVTGAALATVAEVCTYTFARRYTRDELLSKIVVGLSLFSTFNWYFITRSFSNGLEMVLTVAALSCWPWDGRLDYANLLLSCALAFESIVVRPTNGLIWLCVGLHFLVGYYTRERRLGPLLVVISAVLGEFAAVLAANAVLDRFFYGQWTFPLYNFVEFNVVKNLSIFYGTAPWHFYLFQGVPLLLMLYLPFFVHALVWLRKWTSLLGQTCLFVAFGFSLVAHKEIRFLYPLQPLLLVTTAYSVKHIWIRSIFTVKTLRVLLLAILVLNGAIAYFFTRINERGSIQVINYLAQSGESVGFLTPCHSTPWQAQMHQKDMQNAWFLTCEPPLHLVAGTEESIRNYRDESDQFYDDPERFLLANLPPFERPNDTNYAHTWPARLVVFEPLEELINGFSQGHYTECQRFFNSYFHWDSRRRGDLVVYCWAA